jgi:anaerobic glycerol-3-phosphate dehydrogenase
MLVTARNPAYTMEPRQVVVIGAGIAGISAAIQLQHAGYRVTILVRGCGCFSFSFSFRVSLTASPRTRRVQEARERAGGGSKP